MMRTIKKVGDKMATRMSQIQSNLDNPNDDPATDNLPPITPSILPQFDIPLIPPQLPPPQTPPINQIPTTPSQSVSVQHRYSQTMIPSQQQMVPINQIATNQPLFHNSIQYQPHSGHVQYPAQYPSHSVSVQSSQNQPHEYIQTMVHQPHQYIQDQ